MKPSSDTNRAPSQEAIHPLHYELHPTQRALFYAVQQIAREYLAPLPAEELSVKVTAFLQHTVEECDAFIARKVEESAFCLRESPIVLSADELKRGQSGKPPTRSGIMGSQVVSGGPVPTLDEVKRAGPIG
jgi:hypothetical protein